MKALFCSICKAPLHIVYTHQTINTWKTCDKCGEPIYALAFPDGRSACRSLREILGESSGNINAAVEYLLKYGQKRIEDVVFVAGKKVEGDLYRLQGLGVLEKQGYAFKIKPEFEDYLRKYLEEHKQTESRDTIEEFLEPPEKTLPLTGRLQA